MSRLDYEKGGRYDGDILNCVRHGSGTYSYPAGVFFYDGLWNHGEKHGTGKFTVDKYSTFSGDFVDGEITGKGYKTWEDGRSYDGDFLDGEMHGKGKWKGRHPGESYEGDFIMNKRHGHGFLKMANSDTYNGSFFENKFHGQGAYLKEGFLFVDAVFENGYVNGKSSIRWHKNYAYSGDVAMGVPHGLGYFTSTDRTFSYAGNFQNGQCFHRAVSVAVSLDRSGVVEVEDPKDTKKKKAPPPAKKVKEEVQVLAALEPGAALGVLYINLNYKSQNECTSTDSYGAVAEVGGGGGGGGCSLYPKTVRSSEELCRRMKLRLRKHVTREAEKPVKGAQALPALTPEEELGVTVNLAVRPLTLEEQCSAWSRFPANSLRYVNGCHALSGDKLKLSDDTSMVSYFSKIESDPKALVCYNKYSNPSAAISTPTGPRIVVPRQHIQDWKTATAQTPSLTPQRSITFIIDFMLGPQDSSSEQHLPPPQVVVGGGDYFPVPVTSLHLRDSDSSIHLTLLRPAGQSGDTWTQCIWELRLGNEKSESDDASDGQGSGGGPPLEEAVLCRWHDSAEWHTSHWHSLALSLQSSDMSSDSKKNRPSVGFELVIDGAGRMKADKGSTTQPEWVDVLLTKWAPDGESSFFSSDADGGDLGISSHASVMKNIAVLRESDYADVQEVTKCFAYHYIEEEESNKESTSATECDEVSFLCCGGIGVVCNLSIPASTAVGTYVLEILDSVPGTCKVITETDLPTKDLDRKEPPPSKETNDMSLIALKPEDMGNACRVTHQAPSSLNLFKISII